MSPKLPLKTSLVTASSNDSTGLVLTAHFVLFWSAVGRPKAFQQPAVGINVASPTAVSAVSCPQNDAKGSVTPSLPYADLCRVFEEIEGTTKRSFAHH